MKTAEELKALYGETYVEDFEKQQSAYRLKRLMENIELNVHQTAADFACGNGMIMDHVALYVKEYVGVDFSEQFIAAATARRDRQQIRNARFVCASIQDFCRDNPESFDIGFAMDFSEHVYDHEWVDILSSIRRALKPAGRLYLHTPNRDFFLEIMKDKNFILKQHIEHIAVRNPEHNASLLHEAGFQIERVRLLPHYNILKYVHPLSYMPVVGKYFKARVFIEASPAA